MQIDILTLFPRMFEGILGESILKRAQERGMLTVQVHDLRRWCEGRHRKADDYAFGGGPGMVLKPEPIVRAVEGLRTSRTRVVLMTPGGKRLSDAVAKSFASAGHLVVICGHYEGVDERVRKLVVTDEVSIGDYILTGGEPAAIVFLDCVARQSPGVLGSEGALEEESFTQGLLEYPQYTRPASFRGLRVPEVLRSGDHGRIRRWRARAALERTRRLRQDLYKKYHVKKGKSHG